MSLQMAPRKEQFLPRLRQDLQLNPGPQDEDGSPTWTLYDPAANKYYKIGWLEFECIARFGKCSTARELVHKVSQETALSPDEDTVTNLIFFLLTHHLVQARDPAVLSYLERESVRQKAPLWKKALHGYLYFTIPVFKPQKFLEATFPLVRIFFTRRFMVLVLVLLAYGLFLTLQRMDEFSATFLKYMNEEGVLYMLLTYFFMKCIHEMGHAYAATKYGVPVSTMSVAMIVMYPVLYTETSNAWRMANRSQRMHIAMAGVMAETAVAAVALLAWHIMTPGIGRSMAFIVAAVSLVGSLTVNLNPLMRFDGYYLFSDLVGVDNLQDRAFAFAKWRIRRVLWGWKDPLPEIVTPERRKLLEIFGFALLTYRFILYGGISVLVYHIFFKPLGFMLMMVEIGWFIAWPIWREFMVWWNQKKRIATSLHGVMIGLLLVGGIMIALAPLQGSVEIPAVLHAQGYTRLYPPAPGRIEDIRVSQRQHVREGDVLFRISSPFLEHDVTAAQLKLDGLREIKAHQQANLALTRKWLTRDDDIAAAEKQLDGLLRQKDRLTIKAAYDGVIQDIDQTLHPGQWVGPSHLLAVQTDERTPILSGYANEEDHGRVAAGASGYFYPECSPGERYRVTIQQVEATDSPEIFWPELASVYGGPLPADPGQRRNELPVSRYTLYAISGVIDSDDNKITLPSFTARGVIRLSVRPESSFKLLIKRVFSVFQQESGL